jgi:hypothetical protein
MANVGKTEAYSSSHVCRKLLAAGDAFPVEFAVVFELREGKVPTKNVSFCFGTPDVEKSDITGSNLDDNTFKVPLTKVSYEKPT